MITMKVYSTKRSCIQKHADSLIVRTIFFGVLACIFIMPPLKNTCCAGGISLAGPEVAKLSWNTRSLCTADMNNDGLADIIVIDNDTAKIMILYRTKDGKPPPDVKDKIDYNRWEPVLEDAPFVKRSIVSGQSCYSLAAGDLNSDGLIDIAATGSIYPLSVWLQTENGEFTEPWHENHFEVSPRKKTLVIQDFDGDLQPDLVALGRRSISIYSFDGTSGFSKIREFFVSENRCSNLSVIDLNRDGLLDIIYASGKGNSIFLRFGTRKGSLGPEVPVTGRDSFLKNPVAMKTRNGVLFAGIDPVTTNIRICRLKAVSKPGEIRSSVAVYPAATNGGSVYAFGDFNGDKLPDIATSDNDHNGILLFIQKKDMSFSEQKFFPSFSMIDSLVPVSMPGKPDRLLVVSSKESVAGISIFTSRPGPRLTFPAMIRTVDDPVSGTALDVDGYKGDEVAIVERDKEGIFFLRIYSLHDIDSGKPLAEISLEETKRAPRAVYSHDIDGDGRADIIVIVPNEPARIFSQKSPGDFIEAGLDSALRKGVLTDLYPESIGFGDLDSDGISELLVTGKGFVRGIRITADNDLAVTDQFNTASGNNRLVAPFLADPEGDGSINPCVFLEGENRLEIFKRDESIYRSYTYVDLPAINSPQGVALFPGSVSGGVVFGADRFWTLFFGSPPYGFVDVMPSHETDFKEITYDVVTSGDMDSDGRLDIVALDRSRHFLEILSQNNNGKLESRMHFVVFDEMGRFGKMQQGAPEPREIICTDITGDGKDDIILLVHDRVLVYPQK